MRELSIFLSIHSPKLIRPLENRWLENEISFWNGLFSGAMLVSRRVYPTCQGKSSSEVPTIRAYGTVPRWKISLAQLKKGSILVENVQVNKWRFWQNMIRSLRKSQKQTVGETGGGFLYIHVYPIIKMDVISER